MDERYEAIVGCGGLGATGKSVAYEPGPFSEVTESSVESFLRWYLDQLGGDGGGPRPGPATRPVAAVS